MTDRTEPSAEGAMEGGSRLYARGGVQPKRLSGDVADQGVAADEWLARAAAAWEESETFLAGFLRKHWDESVDHFKSRHAAGSQYHKPQYAKRSKLFRPKTRVAIRRGEAACAAAFFSTQDVLAIAPSDPANPEDAAGAALKQQVLQYRLSRPIAEGGIPWFQIVTGQYQAGSIYGVCMSKNYWLSEVRAAPPRLTIATDPETGEPLIDDQGKPVLEQIQGWEWAKDQPVVEPVPPESLRLSPATNWLDPINNSPYLIYEFPMFAGDVRRLSQAPDPRTGMPAFLPIAEEALRAAAGAGQSSAARQKREGEDRFDTKPGGEEAADHEIVWMRETVFRTDRGDIHFITAGDKARVTEIKPLKEVYRHDMRPFTMGCTTLEAFAAFPQSKASLMAPIQQGGNELHNQYIDGLRLSMNPIKLVRDGETIDKEALSRSSPGASVDVKDTEKSVAFIRPPSPGPEALAQQDRLNADLDEIGGVFSASSVQSSRSLNETVGGMNLMSGEANQLIELELRVFAETWVEPTLRQLVALEQVYETDETVLAVAAGQAKLWEKFRVDAIQGDPMAGRVKVSVNVGIGAVNPQQRIQRIAGAFGALFQIVGNATKIWGPDAVRSKAFTEIAKEIFGAAGFRDGERFLDFAPGDDQGPGVPVQAVRQMQQKMQGEIERLSAELQRLSAGHEARLTETMMKERGATERLQLKNEADLRRIVGEAMAAAFEQHAQLINDPNLRAAPPLVM